MKETVADGGPNRRGGLTDSLSARSGAIQTMLYPADLGLTRCDGVAAAAFSASSAANNNVAERFSIWSQYPTRS